MTASPRARISDQAALRQTLLNDAVWLPSPVSMLIGSSDEQPLCAILDRP